MNKEYKDRVDFKVVYIVEAHPVDGWRTRGNDREGIKIKQPKTEDERIAVASECAKSLKLSMPFLIDNMKNEAQQAYAGWPDRLYIIDKDFKVAYQGGKGPRGFNPSEMEDALKKLLKK